MAPNFGGGGILVLVMSIVSNNEVPSSNTTGISCFVCFSLLTSKELFSDRKLKVGLQLIWLFIITPPILTIKYLNLRILKKETYHLSFKVLGLRLEGIPFCYLIISNYGVEAKGKFILSHSFACFLQFFRGWSAEGILFR